MFSAHLRHVGISILDWLLPPVCPLTGQIVDRHGILAPDAWAKLTFVADPKCQCCGVPFAFDGSGSTGTDETLLCAECLANPKPYDRAVSALVYDEGSRELILRFKHGDQLQAVPIFLPWLMNAGAEILKTADLIIPVPLHPWRLIRRRYNQAALLSAAISKAADLQHDPMLLQRNKATKSQGRLSPQLRKSNVSEAFVLKLGGGHLVQGKHIILVDDVLTTGATVESCTQVLLAGGADKVSVLTLVRALKATYL